MKEKSKRSSFVGFTLVELVIVIAVIAILAAVLIPTFVGVIDSANNSADLQLTTNMNTVLSTNLDEDVAATAENIRKLLSDNGLDKLATKNKDMVIVYNKESKKFERMNLQKTLKSTDGTIITVSAEGTDGRLEEYPYSAEEIFKDRIIVSTQGNKLAEAIYALHNINSETKFVNVLNDIESALGDVKQNGRNHDIMQKIADVVNSTVYVDEKGNLHQFVIEERSDGNGWHTVGTPANNVMRIIFHEECTTFDLSKLEGEKYASMAVVLPDTLTTLTYGDPDSGAGVNISRNILFSGNIELVTNLIEEQKELNSDIKLLADQINDKPLSELKEGVAMLGAQVTQREFYVDNEVAVKEGKDFRYKTLQQAIAEAQKSASYSGKNRSVVFTNTDFTVNASEALYGDDKDYTSFNTGNITVPKDITIKIPYYKDSDTNKYSTGRAFGHTKAYIDKTGDIYGRLFEGQSSVVDDNLVNTDNYQYKTTNYRQFNVTLGDGVNLTIEDGGKLEIGGVTSQDATDSYQGHTSGYYGQLNLGKSGKITVQKGGVIDTYGYIKGGSIEAQEGADIYEPFIVTDFAGGNNSLNLYMMGQSPFLRYAMINIQSRLTVNYGAKLWAHCNLYASELFNTTDQVVIGYEGKDGDKDIKTYGLITLEDKDGASSVVCTYERGKTLFVSGSGVNNLDGDIGKTTVTISGKARTESLTLMSIADTASVIFPVPFNFDFIIANGAEFDVNHNYAILPGATVTVNGALSVLKDSSLIIMDHLDQSKASMSNKVYPVADENNNYLKGSSDFASYGTLNIGSTGQFIVKSGAMAAGIVRTNGAGAKIKIENNVDLRGEYSIGGIGLYAANTTSYVSPLRFYDADLSESGLSEHTLKKYRNDGNSTYRLVNASANTTYTSQKVDSPLSFSEEISYDCLRTANSGEIADVWSANQQASYKQDKGTYTMTLSGANFAFAENSSEAASKAENWKTTNDTLKDKSSYVEKDYTDLVANYVAFDSFSLAVEKALVGKYSDASKLNEAITALETKIPAAFTAVYVTGKIDGTGDNMAKTLAAAKAQEVYDGSASVIKALLGDNIQNTIDTFLNSKDRVLFTVQTGTLNEDGSVSWGVATPYTKGEESTKTDLQEIAGDLFATQWKQATLWSPVTTEIVDGKFTRTWHEEKAAWTYTKFSLYSDIKLTDILELQGGRTVEIDLNGFTLYFDNYITNKTFTIKTKTNDFGVDPRLYVHSYSSELDSQKRIFVPELSINSGKLAVYSTTSLSWDNGKTWMYSSGKLTIDDVDIYGDFYVNGSHSAMNQVLFVDGGSATIKDSLIKTYFTGIVVTKVGTEVNIENTEFSNALTLGGNMIPGSRYPSIRLGASGTADAEAEQNTIRLTLKKTNFSLGDTAAIWLSRYEDNVIYDVDLDECKISSACMAIDAFRGKSDEFMSKDNEVSATNTVKIDIKNSKIIADAEGWSHDNEIMPAVAIYIGGAGTTEVNITDSSIIANKDSTVNASTAAAIKFDTSKDSSKYSLSFNGTNHIFASEDKWLVDQGSASVKVGEEAFDQSKHFATHEEVVDDEITYVMETENIDGYVCYIIKASDVAE